MIARRAERMKLRWDRRNLRAEGTKNRQEGTHIPPCAVTRAGAEARGHART